jgi:multidrug efflux pump subunit AcrA (membrane-fusion protein)
VIEYGIRFISLLGLARTVTALFESRAPYFFVTERQMVFARDPLLENEPSSDTRLQIEQAQNDYQAAKKVAEYYASIASSSSWLRMINCSKAYRRLIKRKPKLEGLL